MKVRRDFVTNSSSSSFVISRDSISYDKLLEILLEIANEEATWLDDGDNYSDYKEIAYRYEIRECTSENPYEDWDDIKYDNDFIIDNNSYCRYNWDVIEEVLQKYNIPWRYGYCD